MLNPDPSDGKDIRRHALRCNEVTGVLHKGLPVNRVVPRSIRPWAVEQSRVFLWAGTG
jgi:hypothetical protein